MEFKICKSVWGKSRGLMFSKKKNLVFIFNKEKRIPLHMFFVFYPIDVLFLDKNKRIVEIKKNFKPFSFYTSKNKAKYVAELTEEHKFKIGDKIDFKERFK
ncbi:DUF192 domain-containing protein [Candidatus Woesearchaeota archaeon]|nr:DUF192 domain-containing protein [Candidatus Woesearchaeota archaeon]